ncbi:MAG: cadherin-like beta sandwich domain-containing protein [Verrucomicrobiota bacterium]
MIPSSPFRPCLVLMLFMALARTVMAQAPVIVTQPACCQTITSGTSVDLMVEAAGGPAPTFQWYRGYKGDTSNLLAGETSALFTTPALTTNTSYWVRVANVSGTMDSDTASIGIILSGNALLNELVFSDGGLSPGFSSSTTSYTTRVPFRTSGIKVRATKAHAAATLQARVNGGSPVTLTSGVMSAVLPLNVGVNTVEVTVTAANGSTRSYSTEVSRATASADPLFRYDFNTDGLYPDGPAFITSGHDAAVVAAVAGGVLRQRTSGIGGNVSFVFPEPNQVSGDFSPAKASFAEARLNILNVSGRLGIYFEIADGASRYIASFAPGGVYIGTVGTEASMFVPLNLSGFHTYRLESPANSNVLYFYYDGKLVYTGTGKSEGLNGFGFGDGFGAGGNHGDADWDYIEFGQVSGYSQPSANANLDALVVSEGGLSPLFAAGTTSYTTTVLNKTSSMTVTPVVSQAGATVKINGTTVAPGTASSPIPLNVGNNTITTVVTAPDLVSTKIYTITVTRSQPLVAVTEPLANAPTFSTAQLAGSVTPNGSANVFFEYGTTTSYGEKTSGQEYAGTVPIPVATALSGLEGATVYHYRLVAIGSGTTSYGMDQTFTTLAPPPFAATGNPVDAPVAGAKILVGAVDPRGLSVDVHFQYGPTAVYGQTTGIQTIGAGSGMADVFAQIDGLTAGNQYHFRIVASSVSGTSYGEDVTFVASANTGPGTGYPTAEPGVDTEGEDSIETDSALLLGSVNSNGGTTRVRFEYGETTGYGRFTESLGIGNGDTEASVVLAAEGLLPGTLYHYRIVASNSIGTAEGEDKEFTTEFLPPVATTGAASVLSTTRMNIAGKVQARDAEALVFIDYGTDPQNLTHSVAATPAVVSGNLGTDVSAQLENLTQGTTYHYRVRATRVDGSDPDSGDTGSFNVAAISELTQQFPDSIDPEDHDGAVSVTLTPQEIGAGWRFVGESQWRLSGEANGLTSGDQVIEYRPVPGHEKPVSETVSIVSDGPPLALERAYTTSANTNSAVLTVTLKPDALAAATVPAGTRAQWRLSGETGWRDSGSVLSGLAAGDYVIECKPVSGRTVSAHVNATVSDGATTSPTITYVLAEPTVGTPPDILPFDDVSTTQDRPYAYVGQLRSDAGSSTGFVIRPRVVATAGHVVFDNGTLAAATGLQWQFQRDRGIHEPKPQIPRGYYLMSGYAARRAFEDTPGSSTPESQNLDAAALYFTNAAGRNGFSGYLASDSISNEFLLSSASKTLVGYPVEGIDIDDQGRMHASEVGNIGFTQGFGRTYITDDIDTSGGNSGGPLCVQQNGTYYPAAIYLGGNGQTVVRAIDSEVVALFGFAETSGAETFGNSGGSITGPVFSSIGTENLGAVRVIIEPAAARAAGAGWKIRANDSYRPSGSQESDLVPNGYTVRFATIPGFLPPTSHGITVTAGQLATLTFTYEAIVLPPVISSESVISATKGQVLGYQISASNSPDRFFIQGILPTGIIFNEGSGSLAGTLQEAGSFPLTVGAANAGGAATLAVMLTSLPALPAQVTTVSYQQPVSYRIASSETNGTDVTYTATGLPPGLSLASTTGWITGTPTVAGTFVIPISVTRRAATATANLTIQVSGTPPVFTTQPVATRSIPYNSTTTLTVAVSGLPAPAIQWYQGASGVTTQPVAGATSASFTTPPLIASTSYWARASSVSGSANSTAAAITVQPSANARLAKLTISSGSISPVFNPGILSYSAVVPFAVSEISITPTVEAIQSTVALNGLPVVSAVPSGLLNLVPGPNVFNVVITAGDGTTVKTYVLTIHREEPATACTGDPAAITDSTVTLQGTVNPRGSARAFFQYGLTTAYGNSTPLQDLTGSAMLAVTAPLGGLGRTTTYHYRIGVISGAGTSYGEDRTFVTLSSPPLAATGSPSGITTGEAILIGSVTPRGLTAEVHFEYGLTPSLGTSTPVQTLGAGTAVVDVTAPVTGLVGNSTYFYRIVATNAAGTGEGDVVEFIASPGSTTGDGLADTAPTVTTGLATDITTSTAILGGIVNPKDGTTQVRFEYGPTTAYGSTTGTKGIGNGVEPVAVAVPIGGLVPGREYHFRIVAENSAGIMMGLDAVFTTGFPPPVIATGDAEAITAAVATVHGTVRPQGPATEVFFDYGIDGVNFPNSISAIQGNVSGTVEIPVSVDLSNLQGHITYHYRVRAVSSGVTGMGDVRTFQTGALIGLIRQSPRDVAGGEYSGQLLVNLLPPGTGEWRFTGEPEWRPAGVSVGGLATGEREIEYRPVAGFIQPVNETVAIVSGGPQLSVEQFYYESSAPGTGILQVILHPSTLTAARWRLEGETEWKSSGEEIAALSPGHYRLEFDAVAGQETPPARNVRVKNGETSTVSAIYQPSATGATISPVLLPFSNPSETPGLPYAHVGQIRTDAGTFSGFAVKPRVVATVAHAVFDDDTLSITPGMQWLLQRDRSTYEPKPLIPHGSFIFTGYEAERENENSPGSFSSASQNLDVAAVYFLEDAGRGGYSGYLASDLTDNQFILSEAPKTLAGYPVTGISAINQGRMHVTSPDSTPFTAAYGRTFTTTAIPGSGGMAGGPLCIQHINGDFYPAAICLGGTSQTVVRAIDSEVIALFDLAEDRSTGGDNDTGGGISHSNFTSIGDNSQPGAIEVIIRPAAARDAGAGWRLKPEESYRSSGNQKTGLAADTYRLQLKPVSGFQNPAEEIVTVKGGRLTEIIYTYDVLHAPTIGNVQDQNINEDSSTGALAVTLNDEDEDDPEDSLLLTASSSNTDLVRKSGIVFGGSGADRTVTITPVGNRHGETIITLTVSDGSLTDEDTFLLTVNPVNDAPTLANIPNRSVLLNSSPQSVPLTIGDVETSAAALTLTISSSNATLVPQANILLGGSGSNRTVTIKPVANQLGSSTITVTVGDGSLTTNKSFLITVTGTGNPLELWRFDYFGTTANTGNAADSADPDGDGQTNIDEYAAGTDPNNSNDRFGILTAIKGSSSFTVTAPGKQGRSYSLERSPTLNAGPWTHVISAGPLAADGTVELSDPESPAGKGFYRMKVTGP